MSSFNEKLKEIRIWELILVFLSFYILISYLGIGEEIIYIVIIAYVILRTRNYLKIARDDISNTFSKVSLKDCLILVLTLFLFSLASGMFLNQYFESYYTFDYIPGLMLATGGTFPFIWDFLFSVIFGPVGEELIFRGILLNGLNKKSIVIIAVLITAYLIAYPVTKISLIISIIYIIVMIALYLKKQSIIVPIIISSLFFALMHPVSTIVSTALFGICMCILYLKTENIFVPVFIHMANNLISLIVGYTPNLDTLFKSDITTATIGILGLASLAYILKFIYVNMLSLNKELEEVE